MPEYIVNDYSDSLTLLNNRPFEEGIERPIQAKEFDNSVPKLSNPKGLTFNKISKREGISTPSSLYEEVERKTADERTVLEYRLVNLQTKRQALTNRIANNKNLLADQEKQLTETEEVILKVVKRLEELG